MSVLEVGVERQLREERVDKRALTAKVLNDLAPPAHHNGRLEEVQVQVLPWADTPVPVLAVVLVRHLADGHVHKLP